MSWRFWGPQILGVIVMVTALFGYLLSGSRSAATIAGVIAIFGGALFISLAELAERAER